MEIVTALNRKYVPYTIVMLTSFCMNNPGDHRCFLLHSELEEEDLARIRSALSEYAIEIVSLFVDDTFFSSWYKGNEFWSVETCYRLLMLEMLPAEIGRILYLDVDMIINASLQELWDMDFDGADLIVTADVSARELSQLQPKQQEMFRSRYERGFAYFNAGMMVMNLADLRKDYAAEVYMDAIREWNYEMYAPDQDILNYLHWDKLKYVDNERYDLFAKYAHHNLGMTYADVAEKTAIIHYAGEKPWGGAVYHFDIEKIWWEYAEKTPCFPEIVKSFLDAEFSSRETENYIAELLETNARLEESLAMSMDINKKLMAKLGLT